VLDLHKSGVLDRHLGELASLKPRQLTHLVNLGSPPREERQLAARGSDRIDLEDLAGYAWVNIEGGRFTMGDAEVDDATPHEVTLSNLRVARFPVTNGQYRHFVDATNKTPPGHWMDGVVPAGKENHPVVNVSWKDAEAFATWLSTRVAGRGEAEGGVELPTEAQWEYAVRGQDGRPYPWGSAEPDEQLANFSNIVGDTTPVDAYPKGATPGTRIHDLAGNVWEWCRDWYAPYPERADPDPTGPKDGSGRVLRGGSFNGGARRLQCGVSRLRPPGGSQRQRRVSGGVVVGGWTRLIAPLYGPRRAGSAPRFRNGIPGRKMTARLPGAEGRVSRWFAGHRYLQSQ